MTHVVTRTKCFRGGWNAVAVKHCDLCRSAAALLFCHADSAFMCMSCDSKLHNNNKLHARVWMCEVCEQAPAAVTCKADAASLCVTCDRDIHSANPLARRHHRIAVVPFYNATESILMKSTNEPISDSSVTTNAFDVPVNDRETGVQNDGYIPHDDHWIFPNTIVTSKIQTPDLKSMEYLFSGGSDQILEFDNYQIASSQPCGDSVVPVQTNIQPPVPSQLPERKFDQFEFGKSSFGSYLNGYTTQSFSHSVSTSSMDVGVVPDGSAMSESSYPFSRNMSSSVDLVGNQCSPAVGMDREARVLRYKEKRKNRKFEKTIRYASRKAYAEIRPRIKGRFAKRTDADQSDIAGIYGAVSADYIADARYGVVPSL